MTQVAISTHQGLRIATRLSNHWKHKFSISQTDDEFVVHMSGADIQLIPTEDTLTICIVRNESSDDPERPFDEITLQNVIAVHIDRMAGENFTYEWIK